MNKIGGILAILVLLGLFVPVENVEAAACANVSSFGAVSLSVPELSKTKDLALWIRMQAPSRDAKVLAEINGNECLEIGGESMRADLWSWQTWRNGSEKSLISFEGSKGNYIKLIGIQDKVMIDRILLTEAACIPQDFGNNCKGAVELRQSTEVGDVSYLPPPTEDEVSGKILLTSTPQQNASQLEALEYIVNNQVIQSFSVPAPFDTTLVQNGKYEVMIRTVLKSGKVINEAVFIEVRNNENAFSPVIRWVRINLRLVSVIGVAVGGTLITLAFFGFVRGSFNRYRERKSHGF